MIKPQVRQLLEDRIAIKATQTLRRHITFSEISSFFMRNRGDIERTHRAYIKTLDKMINEYLEGIK